MPWKTRSSHIAVLLPPCKPRVWKRNANRSFDLLGPVGGGKSSLAEETSRHWIAAGALLRHQGIRPGILSLPRPVQPRGRRRHLEEGLRHPARYITASCRPGRQRLHEFNGDISQFRVVKKLYPSILQQIAIAKTEPGDGEQSGYLCAGGKVDIRKRRISAETTPDALQLFWRTVPRQTRADGIVRDVSRRRFQGRTHC